MLSEPSRERGALVSHTVEVVASGALAAHLPAGERRDRARLDLAPGSSVAALLEELGIPPERPLLAILNGAVVTETARATTMLADGDTLALAPPIRAG